MSFWGRKISQRNRKRIFRRFFSKNGPINSDDDEIAAYNRNLAQAEWPIFDITQSEILDNDDEDNVSVTSLDLSVWKSAPTDNEAPPLIGKHELGHHVTPVDAWIAIHGLVYDVTTFLSRHPGGINEIMKGVGKDSTKLFMKMHPQVNEKKLLGKHCIGIYIEKSNSFQRVNVTSKDQTKDENKKSVKCLIWKYFAKLVSIDPQKNFGFELKWAQNETMVILTITAPNTLEFEAIEDDPNCWSFVIWDGDMLFVRATWGPGSFWVAQYRLYQSPGCEYIYVNFRERQAMLVMPKENGQKAWKEFGQPEFGPQSFSVQDSSSSEMEFDDTTRALLFYRRALTPTVVLYGVKLRPSSYLGVPLGYSVNLIVNECHARVYPTTFSLLEPLEPICEVKGQTFYFLISSDFGVTGPLNELRSGNEKEMLAAGLICIGNPNGDFHAASFLEGVDTLVMLANGPGIAPFTRILRHFKDRHPVRLRDTHVLFLYFNQTKGDIIWHQELAEGNADYSWFHLFLIVEQPEGAWDQLIGVVSPHLVKWCIHAIPGVCAGQRVVRGLASGDKQFLNSCQSIFETLEDIFDNTAILSPA